MSEDLEVLRQHAEALGLHEKETYTLRDRLDFVLDLEESDEAAWSAYVNKLSLLDFQDLMERLKE